MGREVIRIENVSKMYDLGLVGTGTLSKDLNRWWAKLRNHPDPYATLAELNDRTTKSKTNSVWALKDINLNVQQGDVLGIIGKNGAGKSTLLKVLSRITTPSEGQIKIKGRLASLLEVGTGMHPEMTARQNVYLNGSIMGMTEKEVSLKLDEIIDFAGVTKYIDTPIKRFSSGMKVRLGFAVAAFLEPEILIVDEVLAVGDVEFQKKALGKMQDVSKGQGRTVLFVSHNMASIQNLCTKGVLMENGTISFAGKIEEVVQRYLDSNSESENEQNLVDRKDRKGSGTLKFTNWIAYKDKPKMGVVEQAISGKQFFIELHYEVNSDINNVIFSLGIFSSSSKAFYTTILSEAIGKTFNVKKGKGKVIIMIDKFPFTEGQYSINLLAKTNYSTLDWIIDAGVFSVVNGDYYGTGILPAKGRQGVLLEFKVLE